VVDREGFEKSLSLNYDIITPLQAVYLPFGLWVFVKGIWIVRVSPRKEICCEAYSYTCGFNGFSRTVILK